MCAFFPLLTRFHLNIILRQAALRLGIAAGWRARCLRKYLLQSLHAQQKVRFTDSLGMKKEAREDTLWAVFRCVV